VDLAKNRKDLHFYHELQAKTLIL